MKCSETSDSGRRNISSGRVRLSRGQSNAGFVASRAFPGWCLFLFLFSFSPVASRTRDFGDTYWKSGRCDVVVDCPNEVGIKVSGIAANSGSAWCRLRVLSLLVTIMEIVSRAVSLVLMQSVVLCVESWSSHGHNTSDKEIGRQHLAESSLHRRSLLEMSTLERIVARDPDLVAALTMDAACLPDPLSQRSPQSPCSTFICRFSSMLSSLSFR